MKMKKLLLTLSLSLAVISVYADELAPTKGTDLPPARTTPPQPVAAPVEAPPPPAAAPKPVVAAPVAPAVTAPAQRAMPVAEVVPAARASDTGWFAGVGLGNSRNRDYECDGCGAAIGSLDDSGFAYKLFGGYRFGKHLALQGGYINLADTKAAGVGAAWTDRLEVDGFYGALQGILPINNAFDVFATAGILRWDQKVTFNGASGSFDGTDLMYGLGASYALGKPGAKFQLEWNRLSDVGTNDSTFGHKDDYDLFTINLIFQF